jgi:hypothetical protein
MPVRGGTQGLLLMAHPGRSLNLALTDDFRDLAVSFIGQLEYLVQSLLYNALHADVGEQLQAYEDKPLVVPDATLRATLAGIVKVRGLTVWLVHSSFCSCRLSTKPWPAASTHTLRRCSLVSEVT